MRIPFKHRNPEIEKTIEADYREPFRYGVFDESGLVVDMKESTSKATLASLEIPEGTKPFRYPVESGSYVDVYLKGKKPLSPKFSRNGVWLDAELCFSNFELSGSLTGKLAEGYQRVGDIKAHLGDDFSLKANLFLVIMVLIAGISIFFAVGRLIFG